MGNNNQPKKSQSLRDHLGELGLDPTAEDYLDGIFVKIIVVFFVAFAVFPFLYFVFTDPSTPQGKKNFYTGILVFYFLLAFGYVILHYSDKKDRKAEAERVFKSLKKSIEERADKGIVSKVRKEEYDIKLKSLKDILDTGNLDKFKKYKSENFKNY